MQTPFVLYQKRSIKKTSNWHSCVCASCYLMPILLLTSFISSTHSLKRRTFVSFFIICLAAFIVASRLHCLQFFSLHFYVSLLFNCEKQIFHVGLTCLVERGIFTCFFSCLVWWVMLRKMWQCGMEETFEGSYVHFQVMFSVLQLSFIFSGF